MSRFRKMKNWHQFVQSMKSFFGPPVNENDTADQHDFLVWTLGHRAGRTLGARKRKERSNDEPNNCR